jgi:cysteine desulfurase
MGAAARIARERLEQDAQHMKQLQDRLIDGITGVIPAVHLNGDRERRLPNNVNLRFDYIEGESILLSLSVYDVAASTGSACSSKTLAPSHVLSSMGQDNEAAHGSLQINIGRYSTREEVDFLIEKLPPIVKRLRKLSMLTPKEMLKELEES